MGLVLLRQENSMVTVTGGRLMHLLDFFGAIHPHLVVEITAFYRLKGRRFSFSLVTFLTAFSPTCKLKSSFPSVAASAEKFNFGCSVEHEFEVALSVHQFLIYKILYRSRRRLSKAFDLFCNIKHLKTTVKRNPKERFFKAYLRIASTTENV